MTNIWAQAKWSGTPFVSNGIETNSTPQIDRIKQRETKDIAKLGSEAVRRTIIPNEGGGYDIATVADGFVSSRADLPA